MIVTIQMFHFKTSLAFSSCFKCLKHAIENLNKKNYICAAEKTNKKRRMIKRKEEETLTRLK